MSTLQQIEEHFLANRRSLLAIAKRRLGEFWAEDAMQDAYEGALKYAGNSRPVASIGAYLNYILGVVIRKYESNQLSDVELEDWMWESGELADEMRDKGTLNEVLETLCGIDEPARSCIYLYIIQGESCKRVSSITGVEEPYIRKIAERFRKQMREKYGQE